MLDFRIKTFLAVCKYMNFTRAAEQLAITQPTVSQHIRWLEEEYGVRLFAFSGKKMSLTEEGREMLSVATTMMHDEQFLRQKLRQETGRRTVRLGATLTVGETLVASHVAAYMKEHPGDRIQVVVENTRHLTELLDGGKIDFALVEGYFEKKEYDYEVYSRESYICVCGPKTWARLNRSGGGMKDLARTSFPLERLLRETLLIREEGSGSREILEKNLKEKNFDLDDFANLIEISNINAILDLAAGDVGITFLYERAARKRVEAGQLKVVAIEDFSLSHEFAFIWRKGSVFAEAYRDFFRKG